MPNGIQTNNPAIRYLRIYDLGSNMINGSHNRYRMRLH
ncbi:hypothetical protein MAMP_01420 [Methylophaga aminisulfidivorans MP]|uniref:Uncharacterized protein n=1 Tax=Methylophaga aminisulfidivorans MP TaxID=1026882 RepID=F5SZ95_9GAMM|nr:hypothetical protein MAMP_01420 [Methylophaga aminisulfidivorans MP]